MYKELYNNIKKFDKITVYRHEFADPDALGSQFGLKQLILDNFEKKEVYALGEDVHTLNGDLFPAMDKCDDDFVANSLAIVLDTANVMRIDDQRYKSAKMVIKIDHHPIIEQYGDYNYVITSIPATSYFIMKFALNQKLKVDFKTATYLYAGLVGDTGRFLHDNTDASSLKMAAELVAAGADIRKVYSSLYSRSIGEVRLTGYILENFKMNDDGLAYFILEEDDYTRLGVTFEEAKNLVNTLAGIKEIKIWVSITFNPNTNFYHISIRTNNIVINDVAQTFGGGGHKFASGIKVSTKERINLVLDALSKKL